MSSVLGRFWVRPNEPTRAGVAANAPDVLDVVPVVNGAVRVEKREGGLLLWVPLKPRWWTGPPLGWVLPFRREKGIALDNLGRQVFEACDGSATIERIVESFAARHQLRFHEARQSVLAFLKMLGERKVVAFVAEKPSANATDEADEKGRRAIEASRIGAATS